MEERELSVEYKIKQLESEYVGIEYEEEREENMDVIDEIEEVPFNADKIRIDQQMLSLKYIMELMDGKLMELNPGYQRHVVWKETKKKSLLIESLMLRIPIPAFYFYENEDAKFQVIDGQQRLTTIHEFINNKFRLIGLEYLGDNCNKKYFKDLDIKYQQRIFRTQMAVNILDARSPKKVVYDIFRRINTGGVALKPQEMRNAICRPQVREFLKKSIENENYLKATRRRVKDERMDAQELVLRFYSFYQLYNYEKEKLYFKYSSVSTMLDEMIDNLNTMNSAEYEELYKKFNIAMQRSYDAFGECCFTKIKLEEGVVKLPVRDYINKSLFTAFSVLLMEKKYDDIDLQQKRSKLLHVFAEQLKEPAYISAITVGTGDRRCVLENFYFSKKVLELGCVDD